MDDLDLPLIRELQGGNDHALDELMLRHKEPLFRFIYRYVLNQEEAADILQETFVRVYFKKAQFKPTAKFATWLYHIALNLCRDHARSHSGKQERLTESLVSVSVEGEEHEREITSKSANPSEVAQTNEALSKLECAIQGLPHDLKAALILVALEDRSQKECAGLLGITIKAVETRVYRARKILESKLALQRE
jgi:RNA polymerase sigma factor (sigma-70 family)